MNLTDIPADKIAKAANTIKKLAYTIAAIGTVASYGTQASLLAANGLGMFSYAIPLTIDLLAIGAAMALQLPRINIPGINIEGLRKMAGTILTVAVIVSILANVWDAHSPIAAVAHAWPVVAYLLGEMLANKVRAYADRLQMAVQAATAAPVTPVVVPTPAPVVAPVQVAQPLPTATVRTRKATPTATTRKATSHAACTHATTPAGRAACRAGR